MKIGRAAAEAGFTLLEIMVAIVVFGLLLAGLTQGLRFGVSAWNRQTGTIAQGETVAAADTALRGLIEQMDAQPAGDPPGIIGGAHGFAFTTELPAGAASRDDRHADIALLLDHDHQLIMRFRPHLHAFRLGSGQVASEVLLTGIAAVTFGYWDEKSGTWRASWQGRTPPSLVRITLAFADQRHWPQIIVAPRRQQPG